MKAIISLKKILHACNTPFILQEYQLTPYKIKLKQPWQSAAATLSYRQGILVHIIVKMKASELTLNSSDRISATGECAPMPEMGTELQADAQFILAQKLSSYHNKIIDEHWLDELEAYPASCFALEMALLSIISSTQNKNIAALFNPDYAHRIKVNAICGAINSNLIKHIKQAESDGFKCIKIKTGLGNIQQEAELLLAILQQLCESTKIRLDCNKSWSVKQTRWFLNFLHKNASAYIKQIDSLEEPLAFYDPLEYSRLQKLSSIHLALDESIDLTTSFKDYPVPRIVLKPTALGGMIKTWNIALKAQAAGLEVVLTSSIETGYGLWFVCFLSAALNNNQYHGLATAQWLEDTLIEAPKIHHGTITF